MYITSAPRILPPSKRLQSFNFVESFKTPWDKPGTGQSMQFLQWNSGDWTVTSNGCMTLRQLIGTAQPRTALHMPGADLALHACDMLLFPLLAEKLFHERSTATGRWRCFSISAVEQEVYKKSSLNWREEDIGQLKAYGLKNLFLLSHLQGIVVAEDQDKKFLHFMFDSGQGFLSNAPMWEGG